jgi:hypothetical protein
VPGRACAVASKRIRRHAWCIVVIVACATVLARSRGTLVYVVLAAVVAAVGEASLAGTCEVRFSLSARPSVQTRMIRTLVSLQLALRSRVMATAGAQKCIRGNVLVVRARVIADAPVFARVRSTLVGIYSAVIAFVSFHTGAVVGVDPVFTARSVQTDSLPLDVAVVVV